MLNWMQILRIRWIVGNGCFVECKQSLHYIRGMYFRIVLLGSRVTECDIRLPRGRKEVLMKHSTMDVRSHGLLRKLYKETLITAPKAAPYHNDVASSHEEQYNPAVNFS